MSNTPIYVNETDLRNSIRMAKIVFDTPFNDEYREYMTANGEVKCVASVAFAQLRYKVNNYNGHQFVKDTLAISDNYRIRLMLIAVVDNKLDIVKTLVANKIALFRQYGDLFKNFALEYTSCNTESYHFLVEQRIILN